MPKRRLYDPIIVQEEPKQAQRQAPSAKNRLSPGEKSASSSRSRTANRKTRRNATNSSSSSRSNDNRKKYTGSHTAAPSHNVPSSNRRSTQILVKLSEACQSHQNDTHPNTTHDDGNNSSTNDTLIGIKNARDHLEKKDSDIPAACQSAITKLEPLLPRLQREIAPVWALRQHHQDASSTAVTPTLEHAATLEDVLLLCDFYNSALSGYYCPHLLRLFHQGPNFGNSESFVLHPFFLVTGSLGVKFF